MTKREPVGRECKMPWWAGIEPAAEKKPAAWRGEYRQMRAGQFFRRLAYETEFEGLTTDAAVEVVNYYIKARR